MNRHMSIGNGIAVSSLVIGSVMLANEGDKQAAIGYLTIALVFSIMPPVYKFLKELKWK